MRVACMAGVRGSEARGPKVNSADHKEDAQGRPRRGLLVVTLQMTSVLNWTVKLAVALANVTEGAANSTVLKVPQVEPSHGFVLWQALVDGYAPKSSNDPRDGATVHTCDTPKGTSTQRN